MPLTSRPGSRLTSPPGNRCPTPTVTGGPASGVINMTSLRACSSSSLLRSKLRSDSFMNTGASVTCNTRGLSLPDLELFLTLSFRIWNKCQAVIYLNFGPVVRPRPSWWASSCQGMVGIYCCHRGDRNTEGLWPAACPRGRHSWSGPVPCLTASRLRSPRPPPGSPLPPPAALGHLAWEIQLGQQQLSARRALACNDARWPAAGGLLCPTRAWWWALPPASLWSSSSCSPSVWPPPHSGWCWLIQNLLWREFKTTL